MIKWIFDSFEDTS